jgi:hypothetical protein
MPEEQAPTYRVAAYTVYPSGYDRVAHPDRVNWCLTVANAGDGWGIRWRLKCLNFHGRWEYEPPPQARPADFTHRCRFSERAALYRARQVVDTMEVQGLSYDEFVAQVRATAHEQARDFLQEQHEVAASSRKDKMRKVEQILRMLAEINHHGDGDGDGARASTASTAPAAAAHHR